MIDFTIGDRVWWRTTADNIQRGTIAELDGPGIKPDTTDGKLLGGLLYLDAAQLYQEIPVDDGIYSGIDDISYHADHDSLSSSGARALLSPSAPAIFRYQRLDPPNPKPEYDFGHAAHKELLGEGSVVVEVEANDWRSGDAKAAREDAWAQHKVPLLTKDIKKAKAMSAAARAHPVLRSLLDAPDFAAELSGYWHDPESGMRLRFRTDGLCTRGGRIVGFDYKTTTNADPAHCIRAAADYGYHMAQAWYLDGLAATDVSDDADFLLAFQAKTPPYLVSVIRIRPHHIDLGRRRNRQAINTYVQCTESGPWPGYGDHIHDMDLPSYKVYQQEQELDAA